MSFKDIKVYKSKIIPDVVIFEPSVFWDVRGNIYSSFIKEMYSRFLPEGLEFIHDKFAESGNNVLRGLHGDFKTWKLISCVWGELFEVVVDMREDSSSYKKWDYFILSSKEYKQILIPPGFVNGYYVISGSAVFHYKLAYYGAYLDAGDQITVKWNNSELDIKWPCDAPVLQERDK